MACLGALCASPALHATQISLTYTGSSQIFIVPSDVFSLELKLWGAGGGSTGGAGGYVTGLLSVTPNETLTVIVAGRGGASFGAAAIQGGYGGGGVGTGAYIGTSGWGGSGGGATSILLGSTLLLDASGGGGGGAGSRGGGAGGGLTGSAGAEFGGGGGTQTAGPTTGRGPHFLARGAMGHLALAGPATNGRAAAVAGVATTGAREVVLGRPALPWVVPSAVEGAALPISVGPAFRTPALCPAAMGSLT